MPKVSIILTLYEIRKDYVQECVDSLLRQSFKDFEILAMDDCSQQVDYSWLRGIDKIRLFRNPQNMGLCRSVNRAFSWVRGEYVLRLGSDDYYAEDLVSREVAYLDEHPDCVSVCCNLQKFGFRSNLIRRPDEWVLVHNGCRTLRELVQSYHGYGYGGGMMFRASLLKRCRLSTRFPICEDFDFHIQLMKKGRVASLNETEPLYFYRAHDTNICRTYTRAERQKIIAQILMYHNLFNLEGEDGV